jgi:hypothetical protein
MRRARPRPSVESAGLAARLARLDARVLPRLARGLARLGAILSRRRVRPLPALAAVLVLAVVASAVWRANHQPVSADGLAPVRVGVHDGDSIPAYAAASQAELNRLIATGAGHREVYALVSLAIYLDATRLTAIVGEMRTDIAEAGAGGVSTVAAYARVPLPRRQTQIVRLAAQRLPDDVLASMAEVADHKATDAVTYSRRAETLTDASLRSLYRSNAALAGSEAQAYRLGCACVYALIVRATPLALRVMTGCKEIRIVDPAPELINVRDGVFVAPLPDQVDRVEPPADDGLPDPGAAAATPAPSGVIRR